jgi:hypothetical protein
MISSGSDTTPANSTSVNLCPFSITQVHSVLLPASYIAYSIALLVVLMISNACVWAVEQCCERPQGWYNTERGFPLGPYLRTVICEHAPRTLTGLARLTRRRRRQTFWWLDVGRRARPAHRWPCRANAVVCVCVPVHACVCAVSGLLQTWVVLLSRERVCWSGLPYSKVDDNGCATYLVGGGGLTTDAPTYSLWLAVISVFTAFVGVTYAIGGQWCGRCLHCASRRLSAARCALHVLQPALEDVEVVAAATLGAARPQICAAAPPARREPGHVALEWAHCPLLRRPPADIHELRARADHRAGAWSVAERAVARG